jgi:hypothetical protein
MMRRSENPQVPRAGMVAIIGKVIYDDIIAFARRLD